jgi:predicted site-specific integrase-resolvase
MALLTVRSVAERLGVGCSTLKHWIYERRVRTTQTPRGHHGLADAQTIANESAAPVAPSRLARRPRRTK